MKKLTLFLLAGLLVACGGPKYQFGVPDNAPDWVKNPPKSKKMYTAIGISAPGLSISASRRQAEARARAAIGRQLESRISQMYRDFAEHASEGMAAEGDLVTSQQEGARAVSVQVSKQTISGASIVEYWTNPENGETWALIELSKEDALGTARDAMLEQARKDRMYAQELAGQAQEELERLIQNEYDETVTAGSGRE
jgi:hypothetical protein